MKRSCATGIVIALATAVLALLPPASASASDTGSRALGATYAASPRVARTTIGLHVTPLARIVGERRTVVVTVRPRVSRYVTVQQVRGGRWSVVAHGRTSSAGRLRLRLRAPASLVTDYRAVAPRLHTRRTLYTSRSSARTRTTRQLQRVTIGFPSSVVAGTSVTVRMRALPVRAGRGVRLQRDTGTGWRTTGNLKRESSSGRASFTLPTSRPGSVRLRVVIRPYGGARAMASAARVLTVDDGTPPPVPTDLSGTHGYQSATVTWTAVDDPELDHYQVYIATTPGDWAPADVQPGTATTDTVTGLQNGTTYDFAVTSVDGSGAESSMSNVVSVIPQCGPNRSAGSGRSRPAAPRVAVC